MIEQEKIYYVLNDEMIEVFQKIEKLTLTNFERKNNFIDIEGLVIALRELMYEYEKLQENYNELKGEMYE